MSTSDTTPAKPERFCNRTGCWGVAQWHPIIFVALRGIAGTGAPMKLSLRICHEHRNTLKLEDFTSPEGNLQLAQIVRIAYRTEPDFARATLGWEPIGMGFQFPKEKKP